MAIWQNINTEDNYKFRSQASTQKDVYITRSPYPAYNSLFPINTKAKQRLDVRLGRCCTETDQKFRPLLCVIIKVRITAMSFRNYGSPQHQNIKIEDNSPSQLFLSSKFPSNPSSSKPETQIFSKIADLIVNLHETLLLKCRNIEIYRDLSQQQQNLLLQTDKNTSLHTVLAGTLAIDSCIKSLEKEEQFVVGNLLRANSALISNYKSLERQFSQNRISGQTIHHLNDSIKFITQQLQTLPSTKGLEHQLEKHIAILEENEDTQANQEWLKAQHNNLMSDLQKQNEMLRIGLKEKESYIKNLQNRLQRSANKFDRTDQKRTVGSSKIRMNTQKSSENDSTSQMQQLYEQISKLREELEEKNKIIYKMNEQFASQMQKYNSVFRRLEEQNRILKKYNDVETGYLLEELQAELDMLRQQKRKDQLIIADIQSKIEAISYPRINRVTSHDRLNTHNQFERFEGPGYQQPHNHHPPPHATQYNERNGRYTKQYFSPNFSSRVSPFNRVQPFRQESYNAQGGQGAGNETYRTRVSRRENKSRARYQAMHESRESKQLNDVRANTNLNLLQRVMSKR